MNAPLIPEDVLRHEYITLDKTMKAIAKEYGISVGAVHKYIHLYGIEARHGNTEAGRAAFTKKVKGRPSSTKGRKMPIEQRMKLSEAKKLHTSGHKKKRCDGYIAIYFPDYPSSNKDGYVMEHVYLMERKIGRSLKPDECVHHINHVRNDNRLDNLKLMTKHDHMSMHMKERWAIKRGEMTYQ